MWLHEREWVPSSKSTIDELPSVQVFNQSTDLFGQDMLMVFQKIDCESIAKTVLKHKVSERETSRSPLASTIIVMGLAQDLKWVQEVIPAPIIVLSRFWR